MHSRRATPKDNMARLCPTLLLLRGRTTLAFPPCSNSVKLCIGLPLSSSLSHSEFTLSQGHTQLVDAGVGRGGGGYFLFQGAMPFGAGGGAGHAPELRIFEMDILHYQFTK